MVRFRDAGLKNEGKKLEKILQQRGEDIRPELREDLHDPSYQDEEGPPPKLQYVWRNIILMVLLHLGALYGITLIPSCKVYTCLFDEAGLPGRKRNRVPVQLKRTSVWLPYSTLLLLISLMDATPSSTSSLSPTHSSLADIRTLEKPNLLYRLLY
ncbi:hypothetical protein ACRRTK_011868 [Alexandromys fortis]